MTIGTKDWVEATKGLIITAFIKQDVNPDIIMATDKGNFYDLLNKSTQPLSEEEDQK